MPVVADPENGVGVTRISPNASNMPCVTPNAPPYEPTSSPSTNTFGSRRISSSSASRIASRYESSLGIQVRHRVCRIRVWRVRRELDRVVDRLRDARFDLPQLVVGEHVQAFEVRRERRDRIAALPHRELL